MRFVSFGGILGRAAHSDSRAWKVTGQETVRDLLAKDAAAMVSRGIE